MCTRFYAALSPELRPYIETARKMNIAGQMMHYLAKLTTMTGEIKPNDMAAVIAPNKQSKKAVFPMFWGFLRKKSYPLNPPA